MRKTFTQYNEVMAYLNELGMFHMDLTLDRVHAVLSRAKLLKPPCRIIHVLGTNGKGSVCVTLSELAIAHGLQSGLFTSPHFCTPRERIRINGNMLSQDQWVSLANAVISLEGTTDKLTYFEFITVMALLAFEQAGLDVAIMEAGLGGQYDAANALSCTALTVYTRIGMDHMDVLGPTLSHIARDKAQAIRPHTPVIHSPQEAEAAAALHQKAQQCQTTLYGTADILTFSSTDSSGKNSSGDLSGDLSGDFLGTCSAVPVPPVSGPELKDIGRPAMAGPHQQENRELALAAWYLFCEQNAASAVRPDPQKCKQALARSVLPGRFERIAGRPEIIVDGAHNLPALQSLRQTLKTEKIQPAALVFACMADKDIPALIPHILCLTKGPVYVPALSYVQRAVPPELLVQALGKRAHATSCLADALADITAVYTQPADCVLLCGSLYLLAEFFTLQGMYCAE